MKTKICSRCKITKPLSDFYKDKRTSDGLTVQCKKCDKISTHQHYLEHKEEIKKRTSSYYQNHKEEYRQYNQEYRQKNKDKISKQCKQYRELNKDKIREKSKLYEISHKEHIAEYNRRNKDYIAKRARQYYLDHKEHLDTIKNEYDKNKRKENINFKILCNLRIRMYDVLKGRIKSDTTKKLLSCSIDDFKKYLESQFTEGMTWKNYGTGGWEIDHIIPCCTFDFSKESEQKECFHYTNLRPLWAKENRSRQRKGYK